MSDEWSELEALAEQADVSGAWVLQPAFIAAANPTAVLALIAEVRRLRADAVSESIAQTDTHLPQVQAGDSWTCDLDHEALPFRYCSTKGCAWTEAQR